MRTIVRISYCLLIVFLLAGCYSKPANNHAASVELSEQQIDSLSFQSRHHYTNNYNFVVKADSLVLLSQQPEEMMSDLMVDTFAVKKHDHVVVADIRIIPTDPVDSVWIQLAKDQETFGWVHETDMLPKVAPDDPISQFINIFSDIHLLIFLIFTLVIVSIYIIRKLGREKVPLVHFSDIDTFYPTLLCIVVAAAATFYASLQMFEPEMWQHFYYHPTLNPFSVPLLLSIFLSSVWAIIIIGIAAVDDIFRHLPVGEAVLYMGGVGMVCAINYVVFSLSTLYYFGYPLLVVYFIFAIRQFLKHSYKPYICGKCGRQLRRKGRCPHCGTMNC